MYEIGMDGLQHLLENGRKAAQYAWNHYEELVARKHTYTLYGPFAYDIGASIPSKMTPDAARKLLKNTRRRNHLVYQLDGDYNVLRTITVRDYIKVDCVHHHFEADGITYAYPFRGTEKLMFKDEICMLKYADKKPMFFAIARKNLLFVQFYEYLNAEKMMVSTYRYWPYSKFSKYGYPIDPDAPIGALNSCVDRHCREEPTKYIDFSHWFQ